MVYDCFQFFNELDILKLRMHVLNDVVDKFVISEATVTFSGEKKPLYFQENREMFKEFEDKIIHKVVDDTPMDTSAFMRDSHQKCAVARGLEGAKDDDIVIFSDVDEIPNPEAVKKVLADFDGSKIYALAQRNFYCYLNMEETSGSLLSITGEFEGFTGKDRRWLGTKICNYGMLKRFTNGAAAGQQAKGADGARCGRRLAFFLYGRRQGRVCGGSCKIQDQERSTSGV